MFRSKTFFTLFLFALICTGSWASDSIPVALSFKTYIKIVKEFHPISKQANISNNIAKLEIKRSRGTFDPLIHSDYTRKTYAGKLYYGYFDNYLKVPAWIGDFSAGYEDNTGLYQNPTDYTPDGGLGYIGYTLPVGQGMIIDYRRAAIKQARLMSKMGEAEKQKALNKLIYDASYAYWDWYFAYQKFLAIKNSLANAVQNFNMVKAVISVGDASLIDSVESSLLMYERTADLQQANTDMLNLQLIASNFIWDEKEMPREMVSGLMPVPDSTFLQIDHALSAQFIENALPAHPDLTKMKLKLSSLTIDKRLARDYLLPNFDVTGKFLTNSFTSIPNNITSSDYISDNNKIIITLNQPLFVRKERAKFKETKLKIEQVNWEQQYLKVETTNQIRISQNKLNNSIKNKVTQQLATANYIKVRNAEVLKYNAGEGSLLKINFYDSKAIEATLKSIKVNTEVFKAYCELYYKAGRMEELIPF